MHYMAFHIECIYLRLLYKSKKGAEEDEAVCYTARYLLAQNPWNPRGKVKFFGTSSFATTAFALPILFASSTTR